MNEPRQVPEAQMWQGYGDFALFQDTDAKIARHEAQLAGLPEVDSSIKVNLRIPR